jgi:hypothetical protein
MRPGCAITAYISYTPFDAKTRISHGATIGLWNKDFIVEACVHRLSFDAEIVMLIWHYFQDSLYRAWIFTVLCD